MRHRKRTAKLGRNTSHRRALLMNLANALLEHEKIKTTQAKAKAIRPYVEKLVTMAREDSMANRRQVFRKLHNKKVVKRLFETVAPRYKDRPGGYLRILKLGARLGDAADMAQIEFV